jgi:CRP/FNR family cyclic AMP-dependent transcriptional regulator
MPSPANREFEALENFNRASEANISAFPGCDDASLSTTYKRGTVLFSEGQTVRGVYLVRTGCVKLSISSAQGKAVVLRIARSGDLIGVSSALNGRPYESTAETIEQSRLTFISLSAFAAASAQNSEFSRSVLSALNEELTETVELIRMLLLARSAEEKLAQLLLKWCDEHGVAESSGIRVSNKFTQYQIAEMICVSRETVTRLLSDFSRRGVIRLMPDSIFILSRRLLSSMMSCEESAGS